MFHPNSFIREYKIKEFPKLEKYPKVFYLNEVGREDLLKESLFFQDRALEEIIQEIPTIISIQTQKAAIQVLKKSFEDIRMGRIIEAKPIKRVVRQIIEDILANYRLAMVRLVEIRSFDDYTFSHSINVSILSAIIGIGQNMERDDLENLVLGALLHDVGKIKISPNILMKQGHLSKEEFKEVKRHTLCGWEILSRDFEDNWVIRDIARHHHERRDGKGYPDRLKGDEISRFAQAVSVADVYDALTTRRPYREAFPPYEAMRIIITLSGSGFAKEFVGTFLSMMSIYPQGSIVRLNTGEIAIVIRANKDAILRPILRLLVDRDGEKFLEKVEVDLLTQPHRFIVGYVERETLFSKEGLI
jgi:putative nucleotidyltransferase with HDIG domain